MRNAYFVYTLKIRDVIKYALFSAIQFRDLQIAPTKKLERSNNRILIKMISLWKNKKDNLRFLFLKDNFYNIAQFLFIYHIIFSVI